MIYPFTPRNVIIVFLILFPTSLTQIRKSSDFAAVAVNMSRL